MGAEADADAEDSGGGEQGLVGNIEDGEDLQEGEESNDAERGGAEDGGDGAELSGAVKVANLLLGALLQAVGEELYGSKNDEDNDENADEPG